MRRSPSARPLVFALLVLAGMQFGHPVLALDQSPMAPTIADVKAKWPGLKHATPADVQALIDKGEAVLFDVRSPEEYGVSHLPGAVLVDPAMTRGAFLSTYGDKVKGKTPVFYCAVGVRSSKLTERIGAEALAVAGAVGQPVTMAGGIFQWNWESRPLVDASGPTDQVHGYDAKWGRLVRAQP